MSQINEDVAKELKELRENKEVMAKELKQLHNKADWLNRCIKIKFNVKRRESSPKNKSKSIAIFDELQWSVWKLLKERDASRVSNMAVKQEKIKLEQEKIQLEQEKIKLQKRLESVQTENQGLRMLLGKHSITIPTITAMKVPTDDNPDLEEA
ncbi:hypothetical protein KCU71_g11959, partial [Aureobasidium melanogenum]